MLMNELNGQEENSDKQQQISESAVTQQQQTNSDSPLVSSSTSTAPLKHREQEAQLLHNNTVSANPHLFTTSTNNQTVNTTSSTTNLQPVNNMASSATTTSNATNGAGNAPNGSVSSSANSNSSASSTASSTGLNSNDSSSYYQQSFNNFKTVDLNNNSNVSANNNITPAASNQQHSAQLNHYQNHLNQNSLANAYSILNNPYLNGGGLLNSNTGQGLNSAQNQAQLLSSFYNGSSLANFNLQPNALQPSHLSNQHTTPSLNSTGMLNMTNPTNLLNAPHLGGVGAAFSDEHQAYEYLHQLLEEKEKLKELFNEPFNIMLPISAKLLDEEVSRIRVNLFQLGGKESVMLPEPIGQVIQMTEKLYVPVKDHPEFNFVGRILGPRGMTAKQLEQETGCKIMVRGKGSMRDKAKEDQMKGKPNWEHLSDELHVLLTVEDTKNRCEAKLKRAAEEIKRLLVPAAEGEDELKKKQLMELAIINGTYRDGSKIHQNKMNQILIPQHAGLTPAVSHSSQLRSPPNQMGQPLILSPRLQNSQMLQNPGQSQQFFTTQATDPNGASGQYIYTTMPTLYSEQQSQLLNPQSLLEYPTGGIELSQAGSMKPGRFSAVGAPTMRAHPYARVI